MSSEVRRVETWIRILKTTEIVIKRKVPLISNLSFSSQRRGKEITPLLSVWACKEQSAKM